MIMMHDAITGVTMAKAITVALTTVMYSTRTAIK